jgi:hypothetical protein
LYLLSAASIILENGGEEFQFLGEEILVTESCGCVFTKVPIAHSLELLCHHFEDDILALFRRHANIHIFLF